MRTLWLSSAFRRTALVLMAVLLLALVLVGLPALAQSTNLALGKPVTCSSVENAGTPCANAVDGNTGTRWSSAFSDPQWIYVDLGATYTINRVTLRWEAAYATAFHIDVSNDATNWTTIRSITGNTVLTNDLAVGGTGRYVRIYGTARATQWGYSLWELQVYSGVPTPPPTTPPITPTIPWPLSVSPLPEHTCEQEIVVSGDTGQYANVHVWVYDLNSTEFQSFYGVYSPFHIPVALYPETQNGIVVQSCNDHPPISCATVSYQQHPELVVDTTGCGVTPTPSPTTPPPPTNLALNKPVTYSSQQAGNEAYKAVDSSTTTRWAASPWPQWIRVDLGAVYSISRTELMPYASRAYRYRVEVSTNGTNYTPAVDRSTNTTGGATLVDNFTAVSARYVRLTTTGASGYTGGWVSYYEFRVFGGGTPPPTTPPPTAPDLVVTGIRWASTPVPCGTGTPPGGVIVAVRNIGNANAGTFVVTVNASNSANVPGLAASAETLIQFDIRMTDPPTAVVDATNLIAESNENNNQLTVVLPVPTVPPGCTPSPPTYTPAFTPTPGPG